MSSEAARRIVPSRALLTLVPYLKRYRFRLLGGSLMVLLTNVAAVVSPWILRSAVDDLALGGQPSEAAPLRCPHSLFQPG